MALSVGFYAYRTIFTPSTLLSETSAILLGKEEILGVGFYALRVTITASTLLFETSAIFLGGGGETGYSIIS